MLIGKNHDFCGSGEKNIIIVIHCYCCFQIEIICIEVPAWLGLDWKRKAFIYQPREKNEPIYYYYYYYRSIFERNISGTRGFLL